MTDQIVRLRAYRPDDADDLLAGYSDPLTRRFMPPLRHPFTRDDAEWYLREGVAMILAEGGAAYAIADPDTDRLVGGAGLDKVVASRAQAEIGYWIGPWARRRGFATAAVGLLATRALNQGIQRLELLTHRENAPSQRVALANGFHPEGVRRGALPDAAGGRTDLLVFARLSSDSGTPVDDLSPKKC